jgi:hypothetical protein
MSLTLEHRLRKVRGRIRRLSLLQGSALLATAALAALAAVVLIDYLLDLYPWPRLILLALGLAALAYLAWRHLVLPLSRRISLSEVAGRVEEAFPEFEDRLRSGVTFADRTNTPADIESALMRDRVRQEAEAYAARVDLTRAINARPARRTASLAAACVIVSLLIVALLPADYRHAAFSRLTSPLAATPLPKRTLIALEGDTPAKLPAGDRLTLHARLTRGDKPSARATVFYDYGDGIVRQEIMTRADDGSFAASLDVRSSAPNSPTAGQMKVWIKSGDDEKHLTPLTVVPRLTVRKVTAEIDPPPYARSTAGATAAGGGTYDLSQSTLTVVEGSHVRVRLEFNKPLADLPTLKPIGTDPAQPSPSTQPAPALTAQGTVSDNTADLALDPEKSVRFTISARDLDGFSSSSMAEYEVAVRPDQVPAIQIDLPRRSEDRTPNALVPLEATAEDDFAVRDVVLHVKRLNDGREWHIPLVTNSAPAQITTGQTSWTQANSAPDRLRMRLRHLWELSSLTPPSPQGNTTAGGGGLKPGDILEYYLSAQDNYSRQTPAGVLVHPPATSSRLRITLISQEDLAARAVEELRAAGDQVAQLRLAQQRTGNETQELADASHNKPNLDDAQKSQAKRLGEQQSTLASQGKQLSSKVSDLMNRLAENLLEAKDLAETAQDVKDLLDRASEGPMKDASADLGKSRDAASDDRDKALGTARDNQKQSEKLLGQAVDRLASLGSLRQTMDNLQRLLTEQQDLGKQTRELGKTNQGKTPDQMSPADRKKLDDLTARQNDLAARTEKMLQAMDKQAGEMNKTDPQSSDALKRASDQGRQQQVSPSQQRAASAMSKNQQNQAQNEQRRAEIGLQVMMDSLKEAERHKLEELTRKLADLQEQLRTLVRRQAGHNLDNMGLRDGALAKASQSDLARLLEWSKRTPDKPAASDLPALSAGQEQTERNTRSLSDSASEVQGAADVAATLSRAASRMERAAVLLRGKDLAGAYEPPQVEALAALVEAEKNVDEMRKKAEQEQEQRQRDTLRAMYEAIRADQDTLLKEVKRLDAIKNRLENAELPRAEEGKLKALPDTQSSLSDRTAKLEDDLLKLKSIVYVWANKDIVNTMNDVRAGLAQRSTGRAVQIQGQQIIDQLDAMIASLTVKPPPEKEFADRGGGGGGGGQQQQKQRLPPETELQLLKAMQAALNKSTKEQAGLPQPEKPSLETIARRQGEFRRLLGDMLERAGNGFKLGPEPKPEVKLPEETQAEADPNKGLDQELLGGGSSNSDGTPVDPKVASVVDRMGRVRQRVGDQGDPGAVTQKIQSNILKDLDDLIDEARKQQQQGSSQSKSNQEGASQPGQPKPGSQQANNQGQGQKGGQQQPSQGNSQEGAKAEAGGAGGAQVPTKGGGDIREKAAEWGALAPRQRQAIVEGQGDAVIEKYRALIDDYYRSLAEKSSGGK